MSPNLQTCISRVVTRSLFATAVLVCLVAVRAGAQEPLTVERAVQATLAHNAALRAARASVDEAAAELRSRERDSSRASLSESWQRGDQPVFVFSSLLSSRQFAANNFAIDALNHPDPIGFFRLGFGVEQLLLMVDVSAR